MKSTIVDEHRDQIRAIALRHGVTKIAVFGSAARQDSQEIGDVDLLIEAEGETTPWFPGGLVADLEELLGCRVDVVEQRSLNPNLRDEVLREAKPL